MRIICPGRACRWTVSGSVLPPSPWPVACRASDARRSKILWHCPYIIHPQNMSDADPLALFLPPVSEWFRRTLGEPTPVQRQGWPAIAAGKNTLLLAPTGSGKTLAAFLACLDGLWRQQPLPRGLRVLYISPLKALNNDIYRNLPVP